MSKTEWRATKLWDELARRSNEPDADAVRTTLELVLPNVQQILADGGQPADFTLHDDGHAFRVAERMVEVMPAEMCAKLSVYELALLLLSAYLHDIGMSPQRKRVRGIYTAILNGDQSDLPDPESEALQAWIDDDPRQVDIPLCKEGPPTTDHLRLAEELTAHYCRHRHNEWSAKFIQETLSDKKLGSYQNWVADLIVLCKSHHERDETLHGNRFNPCLVGSPARTVHLRYLACVLRVADILEFDPERTPDVIFRHRDVNVPSAIHWHKDHGISSKIQSDRSLLIAARPANAHLHKAIKTMTDDIERELELVSRLDDETHFNVGLGPDPLSHRWDLNPRVRSDIREQDGRYVFIDGAFRPSTEKLLQMLGGPGLYGDPKAAVRELLQNAFDAVRERVAYCRLKKPNPAAETFEETIGNDHTVELRFDRDADGYWLICTDDGIGMNRNIIENHLLVSGAARRRDISNLERECQRRGFGSGRTGQFGIGALSYFMLADRVIIETRRSQEANDTDSDGWVFETHGVGSFGELRRFQRNSPGSTIRLHLRSALFADPAHWFAELHAYIKDTLVRLPCQFRLTTAFSDAPQLHFRAGWCRTTQDWADMFTAPLLETLRMRLRYADPNLSDGLFPTEYQARVRDSETLVETIPDEVHRSLRWMDPIEGVLGDRLGRYRAHLAYFSLTGGSCLVFLRDRLVDKVLRLQKIGDQVGWRPDGRQCVAWKGVSTSVNYSHTLPLTVVELDLFDPRSGQLLVDRNALEISDPCKEAIATVSARINAKIADFTNRESASAYSALNRTLVFRHLKRDESIQWLTFHEPGSGDHAEWKPIDRPFIQWPLSRFRRPQSTISGRPITHIEPIYIQTGRATDSGTAFRIVSNGKSFGRIVQYSTELGLKRPLLVHESVQNAVTGCASLALEIADFPPSWPALCHLELWTGSVHPYKLSNPRHPLVQAITPQELTWAIGAFQKSLNPLPHRNVLCGNRGAAASWLLLCLARHERTLWYGLVENQPDFVEDIWRLIFVEDSSAVKDGIGSHRSVYPHTLNIITPLGWELFFADNIEHRTMFDRYMPDPGPEWTLQIAEDGPPVSGSDRPRK